VTTPQPPPDDSHPGNGYGDDNHDHTGPPGHDGSGTWQPGDGSSSGHGDDGGSNDGGHGRGH
jgi:hypothetical protein